MQVTNNAKEGVVVLRIIDSALRHNITEQEIRFAWNTIIESSIVQIRHEKQPPHYMRVGFLPSGAMVEFIAFSDGFDWYVFHAKSPLTAGFKKEFKENGGIL